MTIRQCSEKKGLFFRKTNKENKILLRLYFLLAIATYPFYQPFIQLVVYATEKSISMKRALEIVESERKKHNFKAKINLQVVRGFQDSHAYTYNGKHMIVMKYNQLRESIVKHETFHIIDGHTQNKKNLFNQVKKYYYEEPKTMLYQFGMIE